MITVIGAGASGLAAAAELARAGEEVVVLERAEVGAVWAGRYDRLHLHTVRWLSGLPGYAIPRRFGKWPARDRVAEYLALYAAFHELDVRIGVEVERVDREGDGWVVRTPNGPLSAERVVIATGLSNVPFTPDWPGADSIEIVHSAEYRNAAAYRGRRVLVVGTGNSGAEIAVDLAEGGASEVLLSVRTPPGIVRRDTLGVPSQLFGIASSHLPTGVADRIAAGIRRVAIPDLESLGLPAPARPYSAFLERRVIPIVDVGLAAAVKDGRVRVVAALTGFEDGVAVLARRQPGRGRRRRRGNGVPDRPRAARRAPRRPRRAWASARARRRGAGRCAGPPLRRLRGHARRHSAAGRDRGEAARERGGCCARAHARLNGASDL